MSDNELEDGECSDTGSDEIFQDAVTPANMYRNIPGYRPQIPQIKINSANSSSDEDSPSELKRARNYDTQRHTHNSKGEDKAFINPLLSNNLSNSVCNFGSRRKNNIWGSVLTEQVLTQEIQTFTVNGSLNGDRDVETYDFTKAKEDVRPPLEVMPEQAIQEDNIFADGQIETDAVISEPPRSRKRKKNFGKKPSKKLSTLVSLNETVVRSIQEVVSTITENMAELKVDLFHKIVETIGPQEAVRIYNHTVTVEENGGMFTNDLVRRRTPGGVFIQLLKSDPSISEEQVKSIFEQDEMEWKKVLKEKRKYKKATRRKWKKKLQKVRETTVEDLDGLNSGDSCNELDLVDRPATPEPKDDSTDDQKEAGHEVDDEEEEDIATAIQKAREAIARRQAEIQMETQLKDVSIEQE